MPKPIQIDSDLYARAAAARQGKEVGTYINELGVPAIGGLLSTSFFCRIIGAYSLDFSWSSDL
jgi:hypothetical protein